MLSLTFTQSVFVISIGFLASVTRILGDGTVQVTLNSVTNDAPPVRPKQFIEYLFTFSFNDIPRITPFTSKELTSGQTLNIKNLVIKPREFKGRLWSSFQVICGRSVGGGKLEQEVKNYTLTENKQTFYAVFSNASMHGCRMNFTITTTCAPDFYGKLCVRYCNVNTSDRVLECDDQGYPRCLKGWKSENCSEDVDECQNARQCPDRSTTCVNTAGSYSCVCKAGFQRNGSKCVDIDECKTPDACKNGGTCKNTVGSFQCICPPNVNYCKNDANACSPCKNGGICTRSGDKYNCECTVKYQGPRCGMMSKCLNNHQCLNGGVCVAKNDHFYCDCAKNFHGKFCERRKKTYNPDEVPSFPTYVGVVSLLFLLIIVSVVIITTIKHKLSKKLAERS